MLNRHLPRPMTWKEGMPDRERVEQLNSWTRDASESFQQIVTTFDSLGGQLLTTPTQYGSYEAKPGELVLVDCTSGFTQIQLPDPGANKDAVVGVKKVDGSANRVEIGSSVRTLHDATLYYLRSGREFVIFQSDGEFWCPLQPVNGTERFYGEDEAGTSTSGTTMVDGVSIDDPDLSGGTYRVEWYCELKVDDAATAIDLEAVEYSDTGAAVVTTLGAVSYTPSVLGSFVDSWVGFRELTLAERRGSGVVVDFKVRFARSGGSGAVYVRRVRMKIERVS